MRLFTFLASVALVSAGCTCGGPSTTRARPELEVSPTSIDFGSLAPGAMRTRTLTITSRGVSAALISSVVVVGDDAFSSTPIVSRELAGGETLQLDVQFAPTTRGPHAGRLIITSNAVNAPELLVPLAGDASACTPTTCAQQLKNCGTISDGCSGQLDCGACSGVETCGGRGVPNQCGCSETDAALCTRLTKNCGTVTTVDRCGATRSVDCGACTAPAACGGGGTPNVCACAAETDTAFCSRLGKQCGAVTATDACGMTRTVDCGSCGGLTTCGGGGTPNTCGCAPETDVGFCLRLGKQCGSVTASDTCGQQRTVACGSCTMPATCGGTGTPNVCGCPAESDSAFCGRLSKTCGTVTAPDACGVSRTASCGTCMSPSTCTTTNVCMCTPESDTAFCARLNVCGPSTGLDQCGVSRTVTCSACPNWVQRTPTTSPSARRHHGMVWDAARSETVIFGGLNATNAALADTWVWNGTAWAQKSVSGPSARRWHGMAWDSARSRAVVFGGAGSSLAQLLNDTWEWDGTSWLQRTVTVRPPARYGGSMAYDSTRQRTVLFGGVGVDGNGNAIRLDDLWEWDGTSWAQRTPTGNRPSFRDSTTAAFDGSRFILFGGYGGTAQGPSMALPETWAWNGTSWALQSSPSPANYNMQMAWDLRRQRLVRFGGNYPMPLADTWEWDGASWTQRTVATSPPARASQGMVWDNARGKIVMFGGVGNSGALADTWEYP